ncbi:hypothetical protein [Neobacillus vireti]|uniref:hypothetical protein n=1 Tax=Neobacillus vireti TaxID=220686 RepID=UPI002FFFC0C3
MSTFNLKKEPKNKWVKWSKPGILVLAGLLIGTTLSHPIAKNQEIARLKDKLSTYESKVSSTKRDLTDLKKSTSDWTSWSSDEQQLARDTVQKKRAEDAAKKQEEAEKKKAEEEKEAQKKAQEETAANAEEARMAPYIEKIQETPFMGCTLEVDYKNKELDFTLHDRDILYIEPEQFGGKKDMEAWNKFVEVFVGYSSNIPSDYTVVLSDSNGTGLLIAKDGKVKLDLFSE